MGNPLGVWNKLAATLDDDMMLIYPEMYVENQELFAEIVDIGYLIKDLSNPNPEDSIDWVTERQLYKLLSSTTTVAVISKMLIVRLRLPWYKSKNEWLCSREELEKHPEEYEVLDIYVWARHNGGPAQFIGLGERQHFEEHRDEYKIVDVKYNVRWKFSEDDIAELTSSPFLDDNCVAHVYVDDEEFWDAWFRIERE